MFLKNRSFVIGLLLSAALLLVGALTLSAQDGQTLRVGMPEPSSLDPATASNDHEVIINRHVYDYLIELQPDNSLEPSLATDWTISDDGLTYTFNLVEDATFHDGSEFTADDVVYTFNRIVETGSPSYNLLGRTQTGEDDEGNPIYEPTWTVEAVDDTTVEFTLDQPNADFLTGIAFRFSAILPEGLDTPNQQQDLSTFNGTGPYTVSEFNAGESLTLTANPDYHGETPGTETIEFLFIGDQATQVNALLSGNVDFIFKVPDEQLSQLESANGVSITTVSSSAHPVIRLRADEGHLGEDVRVRQAFKLATDRELLNIDALDGLGTVGNNDPISPVFSTLYTDVEGQGYDPEQACNLIAEYAAENPDSEWVTMDGDQARIAVDFYVVDALGYPIMAEFAQQQWQEGCIDVELIVRAENIYYGDGEWLEVDLGVTGWASRPTPQIYLNNAYASDAPFNESHWSNDELDGLIQEASVTADSDERRAIYEQISQIFAEEGPIIVPYFIPVHGGYNSNLEGLQMNPFPGRTDLSGVSFGG
jgi:peptide/nickel transport system substrate-binding protein